MSSEDCSVTLSGLTEGDIAVTLRAGSVASVKKTSFVTPEGLRYGDVAFMEVVEGAKTVQGTKSPGTCM